VFSGAIRFMIGRPGCLLSGCCLAVALLRERYRGRRLSWLSASAKQLGASVKGNGPPIFKASNSNAWMKSARRNVAERGAEGTPARADQAAKLGGCSGKCPPALNMKIKSAADRDSSLGPQQPRFLERGEQGMCVDAILAEIVRPVRKDATYPGSSRCLPQVEGLPFAGDLRFLPMNAALKFHSRPGQQPWDIHRILGNARIDCDSMVHGDLIRYRARYRST